MAFGASEFVLLAAANAQRGGGDNGGLVWSALGSSPVGCEPPGQSFNLSDLQISLQIQAKNTAEGGWPPEHGSVERGRQGEAGGAASCRPPGVRIKVANLPWIRFDHVGPGV